RPASCLRLVTKARAPFLRAPNTNSTNDPAFWPATFASSGTAPPAPPALPPTRPLHCAISVDHLVGRWQERIRDHARAVAPNGVAHARHEIRCCRGLQSTNAHSR